jgi:hypothetical protein
VLLLSLELWPPQERGIAKHPQIPACHFCPKLLKQSALKCRGAVSVQACPRRVGRCVGHVQLGPITICPLFSEKTNMSTPQDDNQPVVWAVLVAVIVLAIGLAVGFGIAKSKKAATAAAPAATAPAAETPAPAADAPAQAATTPADTPAAAPAPAAQAPAQK